MTRGHARWDRAYRFKVAGFLSDPECVEPAERGYYAQSIDKVRIVKEYSSWALDGIEYSSHAKRDGTRRINYTELSLNFDTFDHAVLAIPEFLKELENQGVEISTMARNAAKSASVQRAKKWFKEAMDS